MCYVCVDRWVWAEGGAQTEVEEALGIGGFGYPVSLIHICFSHSQTMQCHVIRDVLVRLEYIFFWGGGILPIERSTVFLFGIKYLLQEGGLDGFFYLGKGLDIISMS